MKHISLSVFNHNKKKVCDLYDSGFPIQGQAYNIIYSEEIKLGWKELSFTLPFTIDKQRNFRWDYIQNDYLVRLIVDNVAEWFLLTAPKKTKNGKSVTNVIKCNHISSNLKAKNLYLVLDDENGIGTARYLVNKVLANTGWTLGNCDTFYEKDGMTEKVRSISSKGKRGTYQLISDICNIFNAYPIYYGDVNNPYVDIRALENKNPITELFIGKNLDSISRETSSDNLVTRLYVEGQYSDNGYVGIDNASANSTGLPFLLNFDYYRSTGQLTQEQERAIIDYQNDYYQNNIALIAKMQVILDAEDILNDSWGQPSYVLYQLKNGFVDSSKTIYGGNI